MQLEFFCRRIIEQFFRITFIYLRETKKLQNFRREVKKREDRLFSLS